MANRALLTGRVGTTAARRRGYVASRAKSRITAPSGFWAILARTAPGKGHPGRGNASDYWPAFRRSSARSRLGFRQWCRFATGPPL